MANQTTPYQMPDGRMGLNIDSNKTLAATDSGIVQNVIADGVVITLPASASTNVGQTHIVRNGGAKINSAGPVGATSDGSVGIVITPASGDGVTGGGWTAATNKGVTFTKSTGHIGDEVRLVAGGANTAAAWQVAHITGAAVGRTA